jgi:hypothetical protein
MTNHTDELGGPFCLDCHFNASVSTQARLHDAGLYKPARNYTPASDGDGMYDSASVCEQCHTDKEVHADLGTINTDSLECASCHANSSAYTSVFGNKQIHGIRFVNDSGVYSAAFEGDNAANCTTCHQGALINQIGNKTDFISIPKIPQPLSHSTNLSAGSIWNQTTNGYFGPWKNPDSNNIRACLYCHGNVNRTPSGTTDPNNITNIVHNTTALGRVNPIFLDQGSAINHSDFSTTFYCSECHYDGNANRSSVVVPLFNNTYDWEAPPENTQDPKGLFPYFFNHSNTLGTDPAQFTDSKCFTCHKGSLADESVKFDAFVHNVAIGQAGNPNCADADCHDAGGTIAPAHVNISVMNDSDAVHRSLNNRTGDPGLTGLGATFTNASGDGNYNSRRCWACHSNGSAPPLDVNDGMGLNWTTPWLCPDCHLRSGSQFSTYFQTGNAGTDAIRAFAIVSEHFVNGSDIRASSNVVVAGNLSANSSNSIAGSCVNCHNRSEMLLDNFDADFGTANWANYVGDGDGNIGGPNSFYHYGKNRSKLTDLQSRYNSSGCGNSSGSGSNTSCGLLHQLHLH